MRATRKVSKTASQIQPLVKQLAENEYAREQMIKGAESLREGARALGDKRQHPKRRWPKRIAAIGLAGAAGAAAMAAKRSGSEDGERQ